MRHLKRKIDNFLVEWKESPNKKPLIVRGARQIGKTESISAFGRAHYRHFININFVLQEKYKSIFADGFEVNQIIKNISLLDSSLHIEPGETLIFFDEMQACPSCATSLKAFAIDRRFDVICSGSLMGINYNEIESVSVGYKDDCLMHGMDFEEFLWARGVSQEIIDDLLGKMLCVEPLGSVEMDVLMNHFKDYLNNRLGTALSTDEFKNLPTGDLQPLLEYKSGEIVLYQEGNQYKFAQVISDYDKSKPKIKVMKDNNIVEENIGNFFKYPNSDIKQIGETFDRTINNETEVYKI